MKFRLNGKYLYITYHNSWKYCGLASEQESWDYARTLMVNDMEQKYRNAILTFMKAHPDSECNRLLGNMRYNSKVVEKKWEKMMSKLDPEVRKKVNYTDDP